MAAGAVAISTWARWPGAIAAGLVLTLTLGTLAAVAWRAGFALQLGPADLSAIWFTIWQAALSAALSVVLAVPVARVTPVDATGAGDQFAAGFLYGLAAGADMETAGRMGCVAASEVISHMGPRPETSLPELFRAEGLL